MFTERQGDAGSVVLMLRRLLFAALTLAAVAAPGVATAGAPADLYYERTLMARAGELCRYFAPAVQNALAASARQARGAALRTGSDGPTLDAAAARARIKAEATPCQSQDLRRAAGRVNAAFEGWSRLSAMDFPGVRSRWAARRNDRPKEPRWLLETPLKAGGAAAVMGLTTDGGRGIALATTPSLSQAFAVRMVMRDPVKAPEPYLNGAAIAPADAVIRFLAASRGPAPKSLGPPGLSDAVMTRFPIEATDALGRLDPREQMRLEWAFSTPSGERTLSTTVEVGDFAAGVAFLSVGR
ncbi:hypothetical protein BH09PSE2_BH09PSE2_12180 [soil metagenome]